MEKKKMYDLEMEFDIAHRLIEARHFRGLKQSNVANAMGISQQAYSILEVRRGVSIGFQTLLRFSKAVDISIELLLAKNIPISQENIDFFKENDTADLLVNYRNTLAHLQFYESIVSVRIAS